MVRKARVRLLQILILSVVANLCISQAILSHPNHPFDDAAIFTILDQVHSVDVLTSQVGIDKTERPEVRELSILLNKMHKSHQELMRKIVVKENLVEAEKAQKTEIGRYAETVSNLRAIEVSNFDKKFLEHELHFHMKVKHMIEKRLLESSTNEHFKNHIKNLVGKLDEVTRTIKKVQNNYNNTRVSINYM